MRRALAVLLLALAAVAAADVVITFRDAQTETGPWWRIDLRAGTGPGQVLPATYDCETPCTAHTTDRTIRKGRSVRHYGAATRNGCLLALDAACSAATALDAGAP